MLRKAGGGAGLLEKMLHRPITVPGGPSSIFITAPSKRMRNRTSCLRMRSSAEALVTSSSAQGKEMARRKELATLPGLRVYSADPHAPGSAGPTRTPTACCAFDHLFIWPDPLNLCG